MLKEKAITHFGSVTQLAKVLGIRPQSVSQWGVEVPPLRALQLEKITQGVLSSSESPTKTPCQISLQGRFANDNE
ncbi:Cro/CI family transcriptional regulator [Ferrimonas pelagia]|uniref:Cro/CI family transcriptional regulator n=1 Tax=Ferrimonas pelagia TaxID=1177826 RepID=UPI0031EAEDE0